MITVTKLALKAMQDQLKKKNVIDCPIRIGIKGGGCTGFSYFFDFESKKPQESDNIFEFDGVKILIDKKSMSFLSGTEIDFNRGLLNHGFKFNNPNVISSCGCGESISFYGK